MNVPMRTPATGGRRPLVVGQGAADVRRLVGAVAWAALEVLAEGAQPRGDSDSTPASVRSVAAQLGVAKNTAHRALTVLRAAGLVEPLQGRSALGRFDAGGYRLTIPPTVLAAFDHPLGSPCPPHRPPRPLTSHATRVSTQLSLLAAD